MRGILILKFVEARNLEAKDINGSSDPYFTLKLGDQHGITRTHFTNLAPIFDETFNFIVDELQHKLRIEGYDKDAVGRDDPLGVCEIDVNTLAAYERKVEWFSLKEVNSGEIRLLTYLIKLDESNEKRLDPFGFVNIAPPDAIPEALSPSQEKLGHVDFYTVAADRLPKTGIPLSQKAETWLVRSGAKAKRKESPERYKTLNCQFDKANPEVVEQIDKDLERTFPGHPFFVPGAPGLAVMRRVLLAFSLHTPAIGYCQGMAFVTGMLLLLMEEEDAFWTLESIVNDILPNYYDSYLGGLQVDSKLVDYYIMQYFPDLKIHLEKNRASPSINCMKWFLCIYVGIFPTQVTLRIWDTLFCSGRDILIKVYLAMVREKFAETLKITEPTDFYVLLNETPAQFSTPTQLFDVYKHFAHLYQIDKMRTNAQKAISDAINKREELRLRSQTHFSLKELEELKQSFSKFAKNNSLTKEDFNKLLFTKVGKEGMLFMEDMFKVFDKSGDGIVDFREFCMGLSAFTKGTYDERLAFCFSLFDVNGDGFVQPEELQLILGAQYKLLFPDEDLTFVKNFVDYASLTYDTNKDGKFSLEEFKEVVRKQPLIVHFLNFSVASPVTYTFKEKEK